MSCRVSVRLIGRETDATKIAAFSETVQEHLAQFATFDRFIEIAPYWKIPESFVISVLVQPFPATHPATAFRNIVDSLGTGWEDFYRDGEDDDQMSVWNRKPGSVFCWPSVDWASVDLIFGF
jgi:hypothetical protein